MARATRSAATEQAYLRFAPAAAHGGAVVVATSPAGEDFDESDIWGALAPSAAAAPAVNPPARAAARPLLAAAARKAATSPAKGNSKDGGGGRAAAHGSLPVKIPDWAKILGDEYRPAGYRCHGGGGGGAGDDYWEVDDADDEDSSVADVALVPPHELAWRRRAASLSLNGVVGRTLKVRDAVWKRTTGFQD